MTAFEAKNAQIVGVSRDSVESHQRFKEKYSIPFMLLADVDSRLTDAFGTGGGRSTFVMDSAGTILKVWPKVTVDGHAADVLAAIP